MQVIEADVKKGKKKRKLVVALIDDEDFNQINESILCGEFDRGLFFLARKEKENEVMEILQGIANE